MNKHNNRYYYTMKMKPVDVKTNIYVDCWKDINHKDAKFKIGDIVKISKYKYIFAKVYTPTWSEDVFVIKKVKYTVPWTYLFNGLNGEEMVGTFYQKEFQKNKLKRV